MLPNGLLKYYGLVKEIDGGPYEKTVPQKRLQEDNDIQSFPPLTTIDLVLTGEYQSQVKKQC